MMETLALWKIAGLVISAFVLISVILVLAANWLAAEVDAVNELAARNLGLMEQDDDGGNIAIGGRHE